MTRPTPDELHDWHRDRHGLDDVPPLSVHDLTLMFAVAVLVVAMVLSLGLNAVRADRPAACAPYPTYAECAAAVSEGR